MGSSWGFIGKIVLVSAATSVFTAVIVSKLMERKVEAALTKPPPYKTKGRLVSVVIPTFREEDYLPPLLQSIKNQTYEPIEAIVSDSSPSPSAEKIRDICSSFGARYVFDQKLNVARGRNQGARVSKSDILIFTDADCIFAPDYIERIVVALEKGYTLAHGVDPCLGEGIEYDIPSLISRAWLKPREWTTGRGIGIWKDAFWNIGGYNEKLDPMQGFREDLDLGEKVVKEYGFGSIILLHNAVIGTSARREKVYGWKMWKARAVRNGTTYDIIEEGGVKKT